MTKTSRLQVISLSFILTFAMFGCEKEIRTAKIDPSQQQDSGDIYNVGIKLKSGSKNEREYEQRVEREVERQVGMQVNDEKERMKKEKANLLYEKDKLNLKKLEKEVRPMPTEARKYYQAGIKSFRKGDYYNSAKNFKRITANYPHSPIAQLSLLKLAEIFFNQKNYLDARFYSELLIDKYPESLVAAESTYLLGKSYFYLKNYGKTIYLLKDLGEKLNEEQNKIGSLYYYSLALAEEGDTVTALSNFHDLYSNSKTSKEMRSKLEDVISKTTSKEMSVNDLKRLQYRFPIGFTDAAVKGALITQYSAQLTPEELNILELRYLFDYPSGRDVVMVKVLRSQVMDGKEIQVVTREDEIRSFKIKEEYIQREELKKKDTEKVIAGDDVETLQRKFSEYQTVKIGCVLPLSGRFADFAAKIQQGIQLAEGTVNNIEVIYKDSGDDEKNLFQVTRELVEEDKVVAIIGPLLSKNAYTIARIAETPFIPILTPTASDKGLVEKSKVLFSNALTGSEEGKYMAEYIVGKTGKGRYITFRARDSYSRASEESFRKMVEKLGGSVIDSVSVKSRQNDYTKQIIMTGGVHKDDVSKALEEEKILKMKATDEGREHKTGRNDLFITGASGYVMTEVKVTPEEQTITNHFDGVYIAAHDIQAASIASQLRFMNIDTQLLGNSKWRGKDFFKASGSYAKGSIITDDFYNNSGNRKALQFQKNFHNFYGQAPDKYAAAGYSSLTILGIAYERAVQEQTGLITALHRVRDYSTIAGDVHFDNRGNIQKRLLLLEVKRDRFKQAR